MSIEGELATKLYIIVLNQEHQRKLESLGCFGDNLENIKKRSIDRLGPTTRQLLQLKICETQTSLSFLTLSEAFYLVYGLGCLTIVSKESGILDIATLWNKFRENYRESNIIYDFVIEYGVYHYFRTRGWIVKNGANYGASFLLYKKDPSLEHARYAVIIIDETDQLSRASINWQSILTFHRVSQSVSKELLLVFVTLADRSESTLQQPSCLANMKLATRIFSSQTKATKLL